MGICFSANTKINFNQPIKIHAKIKIWLKESHGLYNRNPKKEELNIRNYIFQNELFFLGKPKKSKVFLQKNIKKNKFTKDYPKFFIKINGKGRKKNFIESHLDKNKEGIKQENNLWIFNDSKIKGEKILIKKNMVIRFGRQILKITELNLKKKKVNIKKQRKKLYYLKNMKNQLSKLSSKKSQFNDSEKYMTGQNISALHCRICLEQETEKNPFEKNLCLCSKTMPAHIKCLLQWLETKCKKNKKKNRLITYNLKDLKCDICLKSYPEKILINGKQENMINLQPDGEDPYLIIDIYSIKGGNIIKKMLILLEWDEDLVFSVGRNDKNDIVFKDISVSREHGIFYWKDNILYVFDRDSKFGTYFLVDKKIDLHKCIGKEFVIDKFCIVFHAFNKKNCFCLKKQKWYKDEINIDRNFEVNEEEEKKVVVKNKQVLKRKFNSDTVKKNYLDQHEKKKEENEIEKEIKKKTENDNEILEEVEIVSNNLNDENIEIIEKENKSVENIKIKEKESEKNIKINLSENKLNENIKSLKEVDLIKIEKQHNFLS